LLQDIRKFLIDNKCPLDFGPTPNCIEPIYGIMESILRVEREKRPSFRKLVTQFEYLLDASRNSNFHTVSALVFFTNPASRPSFDSTENLSKDRQLKRSSITPINKSDRAPSHLTLLSSSPVQNNGFPPRRGSAQGGLSPGHHSLFRAVSENNLTKVGHEHYPGLIVGRFDYPRNK